MTPLLQVRDLSVHSLARPILHSLSFTLEAGQILAVIGESGSGKSTLALSLMGLLPAGFQPHGEIRLNDENLLTLTEPQWCQIRGKTLGMVFQEPMSALNPTRRIGAQIADTLRLHTTLTRSEIRDQTLSLMEQVGLLKAGVNERAYPHQLSGGQRQRALLAMALACKPALLIADEFTTALDARTRADVMALVHHHTKTHRMAVLMISHDLGLVRHHADHVLVLKDGICVEQGPTASIFDAPAHPYTQALLAMSLHGAAHTPLTRLPAYTVPA
ncbi:ATP-binding cassette domain-containing protein [Gluconobacter kondonii]|uniref:ATP-binding cassette domain-containing protein n=1 Tax=Gluconobacter kondonii TaxID=941463 RepID=UPI001B8AE693|nr:ABC transporter ATP-binding protein [Gluconobacter kondonii]MBS1066443.1 ABC transporter ATP-binding protein [Gluconobacter kondonii]MBS1081330.1 ABC transporter ATP-binding protein [Gluconobacter kondonii]MBS1083920.1 ABC transporter ATP-binding protein [Gluconobacter kondonii]